MVLVVDIVHSTALYEKIGNLRARETVVGCLEELSLVVTGIEGRVVKSLGDGLLCAFDSSDQAVDAALIMRDTASTRGLGIRVGVDSGEILEDDGDIFGDVVNTAARIANLPKPGEILITRAVGDTLPKFIQSLLSGLGPVSVKGKREPLELYSILEGSGTGTMIAPSLTSPGRKTASLTLTYGGDTCTVHRDRTEITIGRQPGNDLVVRNVGASRNHACVCYRGGNFVLIDQSANGTYVVPSGDRKILLRREEGLLSGSGHIYVGADPDAEQVEPVAFCLSP